MATTRRSITKNLHANTRDVIVQMHIVCMVSISIILQDEGILSKVPSSTKGPGTAWSGHFACTEEEQVGSLPTGSIKDEEKIWPQARLGSRIISFVLF